MADKTAKPLADVQVQAKEGDPYIFISRGRFKRTRQRIKSSRWNPKSEGVNNVIRRRASLAKLTLDDLRRSTITSWAGHPPVQVVQQLAGHSDIATTKKYYLAVPSEDMAFAKEVVNKTLLTARHD